MWGQILKTKMAFVGKLRRGMKWDYARDARGKLPADITNDVNKMGELNFYLDFIKGKDQSKVFDILKRKGLQTYFKKRKINGETYLKDKKFLAVKTIAPKE